MSKECVWNLYQHTRAVPGIFLAAASAPVIEVLQDH